MEAQQAIDAIRLELLELHKDMNLLKVQYSISREALVSIRRGDSELKPHTIANIAMRECDELEVKRHAQS